MFMRSGVQHYVRDHPQEVAFHAFCQWVADASRGAAPALAPRRAIAPRQMALTSRHGGTDGTQGIR